ncbi:plasmid mobilization relaxosome protein MobC [Citrobacter braakii]|uniref:plasmid mobilization relaxosome protein MobC n=1 Tax=Citrobacter braakii TaxID=57706 RepID=UPI000669729B|nr:plasmid mobilization relaxosome protein MobC [Citrobacter braakii]HAY3991648.1 MobC family plasmid mobilization relaxosome protein [Escherichia coli]HBQ8757971.1 plasmid mobilization relaxosome protein MobC [Klebsiella quasipneumoniae]HEA2463031.1 plasmid mobilization relaxosome protein MobC [Escherichia coli]
MSKNYKDRYQRKHSLTLCFNDEEFQQVEELAEALRKPRATAVRELILNKEFKLKKEISKNKTGDVYFELHKIGVNINQIARAINTDIDKFISHEFAEDFINLFEEITNEIELIKGKI